MKASSVPGFARKFVLFLSRADAVTFLMLFYLCDELKGRFCFQDTTLSSLFCVS